LQALKLPSQFADDKNTRGRQGANGCFALVWPNLEASKNQIAILAFQAQTDSLVPGSISVLASRYRKNEPWLIRRAAARGTRTQRKRERQTDREMREKLAEFSLGDDSKPQY